MPKRRRNAPVRSGSGSASPDRRAQLLDEFEAVLHETDLDLQAVLGAIVRGLAETVGDAAAVALSGSDPAYLHFVAADLTDPEGVDAGGVVQSFEAIDLRVDGSLAEPVVRSAESLLIPVYDMEEMARRYPAVTDDFAPFFEKMSLRSLVAVPLRVRGEVIGVLFLGRLRPDAPLTEDDVDFAGRIADKAAPFIAYARRDEALRASEERFRRLADQAPDVIYRYRLHPGRALEYVSPAVREVTGFTPEEAMSDPRSYRMILDADDTALVESILDHPESAAGRHLEVRVHHRDGTVRFVENRVVLVRDGDGTVVAVEGIGRDVTELRHSQDEVARRALHDPLTELPNRALFTEEVANALARLERHRGSVGVLFVDLDRFKTVNDVLGHAAGDELLRVVARRLRGVMRPADVAARLGGDEFGVLVADELREDAAARVAARIQEVLSVPVALGDQSVTPGASIGVACSTEARVPVDELLRRADVAMYRAKLAGGGRHEIFDDSLQRVVRSRLSQEQAMAGALRRGELRLLYQPIFDLSTGCPVGAEALLRWERAGVLTDAASFIDLAEESGLIVGIGSWVFRQAAEDAAAWTDPVTGAPLTLHLNLSGRQLVTTGLADDVLGAVAPGRLCVEIGEAALMREVGEVADLLERLHRAGAGVEVDDFGTARSSLVDLRHLPIAGIKIDRSLVRGLGTDADDTAVVEGMVRMAGSLGMRVTAEGVENEAQLEVLRVFGCDLAQGYHLAPPVPAAGFRDLLS